MNSEDISEKIKEIISIFEEAASVERLLSNKHRSMLDARAAWPDYVYDADDRKDQEPEFRKPPPTAKQIDLLTRALKLRDLLGMGKDDRTVKRKKILWARANKFSYREIAVVAGMAPTTVESWYKRDLLFIVQKIYL